MLFRYRHDKALEIPYNWLNDGVRDCISGKDEQHVWPTCQLMEKLRNVRDNSTCNDVFRCNQVSFDFLELSQLCDGREDCGEEGSICRAARLTSDPFTSILSYNKQLITFYCLPGMEQMEFLASPCIEEKFKGPNYPTFGIKTPVLFLPNKKFDCRYLFGKLYLYMSCMERCSNTLCPLTPLMFNSCKDISGGKIFTLAKNKYLTFVVKHQGGYYNDFFLCNNKKCVKYEKVCNLVNDCGDHSDEVGCTNSFQCHSTKDYISRTKKCDKRIDCLDYSDECNSECSKEIITGKFLKVVAWFIGCVAVTLNSGIFIKDMFLPRKKSSIALMNRIFKNMINIGDFLTGLYILLISIVDTLFNSGIYCKKQLTWLTSHYCAVLGIISTLGSYISLLSMTYLSIFRARSFKKQNVKFFIYMKLKVIAIITSIVFISAFIAIFPLIDGFEDIFVNGLVYDEKLRLFVAKATMYNHLDVINAYFGKILKNILTWEQINKLVYVMFTNNYGAISKKKIHFYGNDGVCLFKFYVKRSDPQSIFVWLILAMSFICFAVISVCYIIIVSGIKRNKPLLIKSLPKKLQVHKRDARKEKLQKNITFIILTDFLCWIPFIIICALHSFEVIDATYLYTISSVIILPINSVINPILYDDFLRSKFNNTTNLIKAKLAGSRSDKTKSRVMPLEMLHVTRYAVHRAQRSTFSTVLDAAP